MMRSLATNCSNLKSGSNSCYNVVNYQKEEKNKKLKCNRSKVSLLFATWLAITPVTGFTANNDKNLE